MKNNKCTDNNFKCKCKNNNIRGDKSVKSCILNSKLKDPTHSFGNKDITYEFKIHKINNVAFHVLELRFDFKTIFDQIYAGQFDFFRKKVLNKIKEKIAKKLSKQK